MPVYFYAKWRFVFIILQIFFFATRAGLQFVEYFCWGIFGRVTRLDQSRGRENI